MRRKKGQQHLEGGALEVDGNAAVQEQWDEEDQQMQQQDEAPAKRRTVMQEEEEGLGHLPHLSPLPLLPLL